MNNREKYNKIFMDTFFLSDDCDLENLEYHSIEAWDSVGQMELMAALEDEFGIEFEPMDFMDLSSYKTGVEILGRHGINM